VPSREYHERLWEQVPEGLRPSGLDLRERFLLEHLPAPSAGGQPAVLDVGCGEGHLAAVLARAGAAVVGIDVAEEPLRRGREHHPGLDLRIVPAEGPWPLPDSSFDVVWAGETLEHVADTAGWLSEVRRVLRSDGRLLLTTPAHGPLAVLALAISPRGFDAHFDPRSDHLRFYTRRSLGRLLEEFRFKDITVRARGGVPGARRTLFAAARRSRF
jgi:2-polyprenyl-3-methyl-5-hydroxy-6-metoxy-1,4-benzoquinol methylase